MGPETINESVPWSLLPISPVQKRTKHDKYKILIYVVHD